MTKTRRTSAPQERTHDPNMPSYVEEEEDGEDVDGLEVLPSEEFSSGNLTGMAPMSFSADNLPMLLENADVGLSNRWRLLGLNTGYVG